MDARRTIPAAAALAAALALPAATPAQIPQIAPDVERLKISPKRFAALKSGGPVTQRGGALVRFVLDDGANVDFTVRRVTTGKRSRGRCVKGKAKTKRGRCTITTPVKGSFTLIGIPGENELRFSGRIGDRALSRGTYRLVAKAQGQAARSSYVVFRISA